MSSATVTYLSITMVTLLVFIAFFAGYIKKRYLFFVPKEPDQLKDFLMWHVMLPDSFIVNRDGSFQVSIRYRGPDLDSATEEELNALSNQLNNIFKRMYNGWAIYTENQRKESSEYLTSNEFPDPITQLIENERNEHFSKGIHFESEYFMTFVYLPPQDNTDKVKEFFINDQTKRTDTFEKHLNYFCDEVERSVRMLKDVFRDVEVLTEEETLTYLHSTISPKWHKVKFPTCVEPYFLSEMLTDSHLLGGTDPILGNQHIRVVSILSYPGDTWPCIFDELNRLNFRYRWVTRYLFMNRQEAIKEVEKYQSGWNSKRESIGNKILKIIFKTPDDPRQEDKTAISKAEDAEAALYEINNDIALYGRYTTCIVLLDENEDVVNENAKVVENIINNLGYEAVIEDWNAVHAWFGSIPGMCRANIRRPLMSTINLAHMLPISAVWAGPKKNDYLQGPVLLYTETYGNTPFRLSTHKEDLGHGLVVGPPGMGKSVLLGLAAAQGRKYKNANTYFFDKGGSSRILTMGVGGQFYDLGAEEDDVSFQPFRDIDQDKEKTWVFEWLQNIFHGVKFPITAKRQEYLWDALNLLANSPVHERTFTGLYWHLVPNDPDMADAIKPYTHDGAFGRLFDNNEDRLHFGRWQTFEMETLLSMKSIVAPTLSYLFHQIEKELTGEYPTFIWMDEGWKYFEDEVFSEQIKKWLKELRKAKASVIFATQSLDDIVNCKIAPTIMDSCPTKIFLPNPNAIEEKNAKIYSSFGLNWQEIQMIANATPKHHYYFKSSLGSRMCKLALGPVALAYCAATSKEEQAKAMTMYQKYGADQFNIKWLTHKNLPKEIEKIQKWGA